LVQRPNRGSTEPERTAVPAVLSLGWPSARNSADHRRPSAEVENILDSHLMYLAQGGGWYLSSSLNATFNYILFIFLMWGVAAITGQVCKKRKIFKIKRESRRFSRKTVFKAVDLPLYRKTWKVFESALLRGGNSVIHVKRSFSETDQCYAQIEKEALTEVLWPR